MIREAGFWGQMEVNSASRFRSIAGAVLIWATLRFREAGLYAGFGVPSSVYLPFHAGPFPDCGPAGRGTGPRR